MSNLFNQPITQSTPPPSRKAIFLFPALVLIGVIALIISTTDHLWRKAPEVQVEPVRISTTETTQTSKDEAIFRAAGWLRAGPYPNRVTALAGGVVKALHVIEGDEVKKDQLLVELDDADAQLEVRQALQEVSVAQAEAEIKKASLDVAEKRIQELKAQEERLKISLEGLQKDHLRLTSSGPGISLREIEQALYRAKEKEIELIELKARFSTFKAERNASQGMLAQSMEMLKLKKVELDTAKLFLKRMKIRSPKAGIIQELYARVGRKQMLGSDNPLSTTVALLFNPRELYVRVDVPLMDAFKVQVGQGAKVEVEGLAQVLTGRVTHISGEADEQKNTLGVRVQVDSPHLRLRPGMLAQVIFLGTGDASPNTQSTAARLLLHPKALNHDKVAVIDEDGRLQWKSVTLEKGTEKGWLILKTGLSAGEKTVLDPLPDWGNGQALSTGGRL